MDGPRFDALTKTLVAARPSRREALRRLGVGALATGFGRFALVDAGARSVGTEAFDLTCEQPDTKFFCSKASANDVTTCKSRDSGCLCARRKEGGAVCVQQPPSGCPKKSEKCSDRHDCDKGQACIKVKSCCPDNPDFGKCVDKCPK